MAWGVQRIERCRLCPGGTYNALDGQTGCRPCGQFATSEEGSKKCECIGRFRTYSSEDASCRCLSGFDYKDEQGKSYREVSSKEDCAPMIYPRCNAGGGEYDIPRSPDGQCTAKDDCKGVCPNGEGVRSSVLGVCNCDLIPPVDLVCN